MSEFTFLVCLTIVLLIGMITVIGLIVYALVDCCDGNDELLAKVNNQLRELDRMR